MWKEKLRLDFWMHCVAVGGSVLFTPHLFADTPVAIIGGQDNMNTDPYAALVFPSGSTLNLSGWAAGVGVIQSVAINNSGAGVIGGSDSSGIYAALVSAGGVTTNLSGWTGNGSIKSVAINASGVAVIGGTDNGSLNPYAASVSSSGVVTNLSGWFGGGLINSVAINASGTAIIGGLDAAGGYAALVAPGSNMAVKLINLPLTVNSIYSVAINASGAAIIGGNDLATDPYAALVSSSGVFTNLSGWAAGTGTIQSVAINDSGAAIIGGLDNAGIDPYAALITPGGFVTNLSGWTGGGEIKGVAINASGAAIIGGRDHGGGEPYAALVSPSGVVTNLSGWAAGGEIFGVAINDSGAAIIGGTDNGGNDVYAALVSPSGVLTDLSGWTGGGVIYSVAINNSSILNNVVPTSFGSGNSYMNAVMPAVSFLSNHLKEQLLEPSPATGQYVTSRADVLLSTGACEKAPYRIWGGPIGAYARQDRVATTPKMENWIGGIVFGFDYQEHSCPYDYCVGGGASYVFDYVHLSDGGGHAKIQQELLVAYGTFQGDHFLLEAALWGGIYQTHNDRHTLGFISSKSYYRGGLLVPHLELDVPYEFCQAGVIVCPFVQFDWANNWQGKVQEHGASGFNLNINSLYSSLLRSEVGLRLFEEKRFGWGLFALEEKLSYVNKKPFNAGPVSTFFVGSISTFTVDTFSSEVQNLGAGQISAFFLPSCTKYPYGQVTYQIEFGSGFLLNTLALEIGKEF